MSLLQSLMFVVASFSAGEVIGHSCHRELRGEYGIISYPDLRKHQTQLPDIYNDSYLNLNAQCVCFAEVDNDLLVEFTDLAPTDQNISVYSNAFPGYNAWQTEKVIFPNGRRLQTIYIDRRSRVRIVFDREKVSFTLRYFKPVWSYTRYVSKTTELYSRTSPMRIESKNAPRISKPKKRRDECNLDLGGSGKVIFPGEPPYNRLPGFFRKRVKNFKCIYYATIPNGTVLKMNLKFFDIPYSPILLEFHSGSRWRLGSTIGGYSRYGGASCRFTVEVVGVTFFRIIVPNGVVSLEFDHEMVERERAVNKIPVSNVNYVRDFKCPILPSSAELLGCTKSRGKRNCTFRCKKGYLPRFIDPRKYLEFKAECRFVSGKNGTWLPAVDHKPCVSESEFVATCISLKDNKHCKHTLETILVWAEGIGAKTRIGEDPYFTGEYDGHFLIGGDGAEGRIMVIVSDCTGKLLSPERKFERGSCKKYCHEENCGETDKPMFCVRCQFSPASPCQVVDNSPSFKDGKIDISPLPRIVNHSVHSGESN